VKNGLIIYEKKAIQKIIIGGTNIKKLELVKVILKIESLICFSI